MRTVILVACTSAFCTAAFAQSPSQYQVQQEYNQRAYMQQQQDFQREQLQQQRRFQLQQQQQHEEMLRHQKQMNDNQFNQQAEMRQQRGECSGRIVGSYYVADTACMVNKVLGGR